ncbi:phosphatidylinositol 3-kinase vps34 [Elysia marginata]|uniref:Phosphatidylinositol 3-kinase vps34 n=1 Tax=Elysia marginata TaxID=1093978 RepID=A0AAV4IV13_9GAST|nr:phosphatidylinositol 3-kinase vps34 [Elysia marginata]
MADDADVPPLEDMTEVVQKADAIRESRNGPSKPNGVSSTSAKQRAKVVKKPATHVVKPSCELVGKGDAASDQPVETKKAVAPTTKPSNTGMFGGMKKGFLFGSPGASNKKASASSTKPSSAKASAENSKKSTENIPYITPKGQTKSELAFDEVQQAMSEAKGLLENQDWITNDLLTKIEKNDTLRNKFADVKFMQALEEFQKDPEGAMQKYKGNQEVEKFLQEFCGLLGDHFTSLGDGSAQPKPETGSSQSSQPVPVKSPKNSSSPQITEISTKDSKASGAAEKTPKIVELLPDKTEPPSSKPKQSSKAKIVELDKEDDSAPSAFSKLNIDTASSQSTSRSGGSGKGRVPDILTYTPGAGADIQEVPKAPLMDDEEVREVLKDQKVMETLMDPQVMNIIQLLRSNPEKAQRIVDKATGDLKEKITLLIMKGLLRFQAS